LAWGTSIAKEIVLVLAWSE